MHLLGAGVRGFVCPETQGQGCNGSTGSNVRCVRLGVFVVSFFCCKASLCPLPLLCRPWVLPSSYPCSVCFVLVMVVQPFFKVCIPLPVGFRCTRLLPRQLVAAVVN